jgi:EH domain-containing protein 1
VYIGSFNSEAPISEEKNPYGRTLFEAEQKELLADLYEIPQRSCDRKINEFVKRLRAFKIHLLLIGHIRKNMPAMFGECCSSAAYAGSRAMCCVCAVADLFNKQMQTY